MTIQEQGSGNDVIEVQLPGPSGPGWCAEMIQQQVQPSSSRKTSWLQPNVGRVDGSILKR